MWMDQLRDLTGSHGSSGTAEMNGVVLLLFFIWLIRTQLAGCLSIRFNRDFGSSLLFFFNSGLVLHALCYWMWFGLELCASVSACKQERN